MTISCIGAEFLDAFGRSRLKVEQMEMVLKDGTVRTVRLSPRDPQECFFCDAPPTCRYTGRAVVMNLKDTAYGRALGNSDISAEVFSAGDWPACDPCRAFIDADQWGRLARHVGLRRLPAEWGLIRTALALPARALR